MCESCTFEVIDIKIKKGIYRYLKIIENISFITQLSVHPTDFYLSDLDDCQMRVLYPNYINDSYKRQIYIIFLLNEKWIVDSKIGDTGTRYASSSN